MHHRRRRRVKNSEEIEAVVNLTPLIDVVFVVLIMFILVAPMLEMDQVLLAGSEAHHKQVSPLDDSSFLEIHVREDNSVWIEKRKVDPEKLYGILSQLRKHSIKHKIRLFHDRRAFFGTYQNVKNAAERAGFEEMNVMLHPS